MTDTTEPVDTTGQDIPDKINKLLTKAESVAGTPEADALIAKATQLMIKHEIDEAMLAASRGKNAPDEIVEVTLEYTGIFKDSTMTIGFACAKANGCKAFYRKQEYVTPKRIDLIVIGYQSDCRNVTTLNTSLSLQCASALNDWWKAQSTAYNWNKGVAYKAKREFIMGFASAVGTKMMLARKAAEQEAAKTEAERTHTTKSVAEQSVALVLRSRRDSVNDWYDEKYSKSVRKVTRRYSSGGLSARTAGESAGMRASTGGTAVKSNQRAIGH